MNQQNSDNQKLVERDEESSKEMDSARKRSPLQDMDVSLFDLLATEGTQGDSLKLLKQTSTKEDAHTKPLGSLFFTLTSESHENLGPISPDPRNDSSCEPPNEKKHWRHRALGFLVLAIAAEVFIRVVPTSVFNRTFQLDEKERLNVEHLSREQHKDLTVPKELGRHTNTLDFTPLVNSTPVFALSGLPTWSPLLVTPVPTAAASAQELENLVKWINNPTTDLLSAFRDHGGFVFRGFGCLKDPAAFEAVAGAVAGRLGLSLQDTYLGSSPRSPVKGTKSVYTSVEFPGSVPIADHAEMSFLPSPPAFVIFSVYEIGNVLGSQILPGGETALIDYSLMWQTMDPGVRERFAGGVKYTRRYPSEASWWGRWKLMDPRFSKTWQAMFNTMDPDEAEALARQNGMEVTWEEAGAFFSESGIPGSESATMVLVNVGPAARVHPWTGVESWHTHLHQFHTSSVPDGLALGAHLHEQHGHRRAAWRFLARRAAVLAFDRAMRWAVGEKALGQQCHYADGSAIAAEDADYVRRLAWHHMLVFPHAEGDVHVIDNFHLAHSRTPFDLFKKRTLHATWTGAHATSSKHGAFKTPEASALESPPAP